MRASHTHRLSGAVLSSAELEYLVLIKTIRRALKYISSMIFDGYAVGFASRCHTVSSSR